MKTKAKQILFGIYYINSIRAAANTCRNTPLIQASRNFSTTVASPPSVVAVKLKSEMEGKPEREMIEGFKKRMAGVDPKTVPMFFDTSQIKKLWVKNATLIHKEEIGKNVKLLRFKLPEETKDIFQDRGVPSSVKVKAFGMFKSYDPITMPENEDYVDFMIKGYGVREDGTKGMAQSLIDMENGAQISFLVKAKKLFFGKPLEVNSYPWLSFICGGSGLAPFLQISRFLLRNPEDKTKIFLTYANRTPEDIIFLEELLKFEKDYPDRFFLNLVLSKPEMGQRDVGHAFSEGWVKASDIQENVLANLEKFNLEKEEGAVFVCGTRQFLDTVCGDKIKNEHGKSFGPLRGVLKELDFAEKQVFKL